MFPSCTYKRPFTRSCLVVLRLWPKTYSRRPHLFPGPQFSESPFQSWGKTVDICAGFPLMREVALKNNKTTHWHVWQLRNNTSHVIVLYVEKHLPLGSLRVTVKDKVRSFNILYFVSEEENMSKTIQFLNTLNIVWISWINDCFPSGGIPIL